MTRRDLFAAPLAAGVPAPEPAKRKRILIVYDPAQIIYLEEEFRAMNIDVIAIPTDPLLAGPDIRLFDLDGLPDAELGQIREMVAKR